MSIIITQNGKNTQKLDRSQFESESSLQEYIYNNPESIPLYELDDDIKLLILAREYPTNSGPIDAIGIDRNGNLFIIETKLYNNADKRKVVAQALDYGAALWKHANDFSEFLRILDVHCHKQFSCTMREKVQSYFELEESEVDDLLQHVEMNLNDGVFKFVVLMDELDSRLKDLILYVNQNSQFDIYAVQFEYYLHDSYEIIIPKIFGVEVKKDIRVKSNTSQRKKWNKQMFLEEVKRSLSVNTICINMYEFSENIATSINWGTGTRVGSANFIFDHISNRSLYTLKSNGDIVFNFGWMDEEMSIPFRDLLYKNLQDNGLIQQTDVEKLWYVLEYEQWKKEINTIKEIISSVVM